MRRVIDRILWGVALLAVRGSFRTVELAGFAGRHVHPVDPRRRRPVLVVANHFNGFVDPVLLAAALGRLPRFLAKATLWKVLPARPFLRLAGLIPVHRPEDHEGTGNEGAFGAAVRVLARGGVVAVFPEGTTHNVPRLARIRTGTARIAFAAGILVNVIPALVVAVAGGAVRVPVTKGTVRLLVAMVVFPATWVLVGVFDVGGHVVADGLSLATFPLSPLTEWLFDGRGGVGPSVLVFVAAPLLGFAAVFLFELWTSLVRAWRAWLVVVNRRARLAELRTDRAALVADVRAVSTVEAAS